MHDLRARRQFECLSRPAKAIQLDGLSLLADRLHRFVGCTDRFHAIFHMPRSLKKVDVIYICFLLFYHIELYINKILSSCTFIIYRIKGFHSDHIYTGWPSFIEMG